MDVYCCTDPTQGWVDDAEGTSMEDDTTTPLMATSTAPHVCAQGMDDETLARAVHQCAEAVRQACLAGRLRSSDPSLVPDLDAPEPTDDELAEAAWLRLLLLAVSMEVEYRHGRRPPEAAILDRVPRPADHKWRVPARPLGHDPEEHRRRMLDHWLRMADADRVPQWTRRGPPEWMFRLVWIDRTTGVRRASV